MARGARPSSVTEICAGSIYAVGGSIDLDDRRLTWIADDARGWLPVQAYVLRDGPSLLELDTGLTVHRKEIAEGLDWVMQGATDRRILITRREPDAFINFGWIVPHVGINLLYYSGEQNPLNLFESFDLASDEVHLHHIFKGAIENIAAGNKLVVGRLSVEVIRTSLRMISAVWLYESTTRTLFTSDSFAFVTAPHRGASPHFEPTDEQISVERIQAYLGKKFDWLRGIDSSVVIADLEKLYASRVIERICPTYGCIIEGRSAVERVFERTIVAIKALAKLPPRGALGDFRWNEPASASAA